MIKNITLRFFPLFLFLCFVHVLPGQSGNFVQRFSWEGSEYALRYEVVIESEVDGEYQSLLREFTDIPFMEVSLPPGNYRLQIILHDIRDIPVGETEWQSFQIHAPIPEPEEQIEEPEIIVLVEEPEQEIQSAETEQVKEASPFDMFAGAAWMPLIPVYKGEGDIFDTPSFAGIAVRFGMIYNKDFLNLYPGLDFTVSWHSANGEQTITATLNFMAQKRLNDKAAVNFRLGAGYTILPDRETLASAAQRLHTNLGLSFMWFAFDPVFIEAGFDYNHYFTNKVSGCLRPWIGAGVRF